MIREYTEKDKELVKEYLSADPHGRAIFAAVEAYGNEERFQTVYIDVEGVGSEEGISLAGVYLCLYRNLLLYSSQNQVQVDFLEQMFPVLGPDVVVGRKDNVNIAGWLLTDYEQKTQGEMPVIRDDKGEAVECFDGVDVAGEWAVLLRQG